MALLAALAFTFLVRHKLHASHRIRQERQWLRQAARQLGEAGPPSSDLRAASSSSSWVLPGYLVFSNGWAAYKLHSIHEGNELGDLAVLRFSDGAFYFSKSHFCSFAPNLTPDGTLPQPADGSDFLQRTARVQEWTLLSLDGHTWCVVLCPEAERRRAPRKTLWVWIGSFDGDKETTQFEHRYALSGGYLSWNTDWASKSALQVQVFDYGNSAPYREYDGATNVITHPLLTLRFQQDQQTGKFTQQE